MEDAKKLRERSIRALSSLFDGKTGLMGHRRQAGDFVSEPPDTWGDGFVEGSAWQHSFPSYNLSELVRLHGGRHNLLVRLQQLISMPTTFLHGSYREEIHEMREMRLLGMGQYGHNNQPVHHMLYLFAMLGDHNTTAALVRRVLLTAYSPLGFSGDEDNGEMGAWFVLSALGLYAPAVGVSEDYVLGALPLFPRVKLHELDVVIEAPAAAKNEVSVVETLWNGKPVSGTSLPYSVLRNSGVLHFLAPGDRKIGLLVSNVRGALHKVVRGVGKGLGIPKSGGPVKREKSAQEESSVPAIVAGLLLLGIAGYWCNRRPSTVEHTD